MEFATLEWVDWFNNRRLLEVMGHRPPAEGKWRTIANGSTRHWPRDSNETVSGRPGAVQFYEIRRNFQTYGAHGLLDRLSGPGGPHPNRVPAVVEEAISPHHGPSIPRRVAGRAGASADGHSGVGRRTARGVAAPRFVHQARTAIAAGQGHLGTQHRAHRGSDPAPGALQPGVPRTPHPIPTRWWPWTPSLSAR